MKKVATLFFLLSLFFTDSIGQWYEKKYNVSDIDFLTREQLEDAKHDSKNGVYVSLVAGGLGGLAILLENLMPYSLEDEEDPGFFEQLLGDKGMHKVIIGTGIGLAGVGTIACISYLGRLGTINSALNRNFPDGSSLTVTPAIELERYSHSLCPGLMVTYSF